MRAFLKDPDAVLDYGIDWSEWLQSGETLSTSTWIIPDGINEDDSSFNETATVVWISGGTIGRTYPLTNRITTTHGRTDDRTIYIRVIER